MGVKGTMKGWWVMGDGVIGEFRERTSTASMHIVTERYLTITTHLGN
jgi:hypothetical protein